ncbi:WD40-repeat-containing domain protein [Suillus paluster]|uniref:WD40-repeat-containing domain protein n=1 Tax=Suillus paluster TaxID=48578 RepID=UPI001B87CB09|nr:WD40-repeat-containing domain protein [Suillus paluster]KAG1731179.1 WD40-repeat-containing domain protein [Suillus paluster]
MPCPAPAPMITFEANREKQRVPAIEFLLGDKYIIVSHDDCLQVREAKTGKLVGDPWQDKERSQIYAFDVSPKGDSVATASKDGKIRVWRWNGKTAKVLATKSKGYSAPATCVRWSQHDGGAHIASGFDDGSVAVWSVTASELKNPMRTDNTRLRHIHAIDYSHDGAQLIVSGYDREISRLTIDKRKQEVQLDKVVKICNNPDHVSCATWASTADGHAIVTGSTDGRIRIVELPDGRLSELVGHSDLVCAIRVVALPRKRVLASASYDNTLRLWDLDAKRRIGQPLPHSAELTCAAVAADGTLVATGTCDGQIYVWNLPDLLSGATEDVNGCDSDEDANARSPFNPDSPISTRQTTNGDPTRRLTPARPVVEARRLPPGFFDDLSVGRGSMSVTTPAQDKKMWKMPNLLPFPRLARRSELHVLPPPSISHVEVAASRRQRISSTPLSAALDQQGELITEDAVLVPRTRWVKILLRCVILSVVFMSNTDRFPTKFSNRERRYKKTRVALTRAANCNNILMEFHIRYVWSSLGVLSN